MIHQEPVYVISFPKTGRTWLTYTLVKYFHHLIGKEEEFTFRNFSETFFTIGIKERPNEYAQFPHIITEHGGPEQIPEGAKGAIIVRNVLDTAVSWFFHRGGSKKTIIDGEGYDLFGLVEKELVGIAANFVYMIKQAEEREFCILHYRALGEENTYVEFFNYAGYSIDEECLKYAIRESSFDKMVVFEEKNPMNLEGYPEEDARRVRRGKIFGYKDYLTNEQVKQLEQKCVSELDDYQIDCLKQYYLFYF